ncbi:MAG: cytochrome c [Anaerolineae bacterium]|nr:cytochrome c [Anaerolineae bacterium]
MRYFLFLLLFVAACQPDSRSPDDAAGEVVYVQYCASCHGIRLEGQPDWKVQNEDGSFKAPPHDDSGHTWHHGDPTLEEAIRLGGARLNDLNIGGTSNMPAFAETLSDEQITAVLSYIKSTWKEENRAWQQEATIREQTSAQ